jgi:cation-dependent mannose-6-phosphate receptor
MDGIAATIVGVLLVTYHYGCVICETTAVCQCEFPKHTSRSEDLEKLIAPLCGKRFTAEDNDPDGYTFSIGICTSGVVAASKDMEKAGVIQTAKKESDHRSFNIGGFDRTEIMAGNNWILLEYEGGGNYHSSCGQENKRTNIMITCNPRETVGTMRWIEENHNKSADCYYLFELEHNVACTAQPLGKKTLSTGSVICILYVPT